MTCTCPEWVEGIEKINAPIVMQSLRSGGSWQYDGVPFRYCPWCGTTLAALRAELTETEEGEKDER